MLKSNHAFNPWTTSDFIWGALLQVLRQGWTSKREGSGQEELRHFLMSELRTSTPSVTRASQHRKCLRSKKRREEAQVPAADVRCRNGFVYTFGVWNQRRNGKRVSEVLKASRRQDSSERYRVLSYCNHLAQDTDFVWTLKICTRMR